VDLFAKTCNYDAMGIERLAARLFVGLGGLLWIVLTAGASFAYPSSPTTIAYLPSLLVVALAVVAFLVGWFYESAAAVLLFAGAVATVVWGVLAGWEAGVWGVMAIFLIAPEVIAGLLFLMSARMQKACTDTATRA
jgi:hypothetical protein